MIHSVLFQNRKTFYIDKCAAPFVPPSFQIFNEPSISEEYAFQSIPSKDKIVWLYNFFSKFLLNIYYSFFPDKLYIFSTQRSWTSQWMQHSHANLFRSFHRIKWISPFLTKLEASNSSFNYDITKSLGWFFLHK